MSEELPPVTATCCCIAAEISKMRRKANGRVQGLSSWPRADIAILGTAASVNIPCTHPKCPQIALNGILFRESVALQIYDLTQIYV